MDNADKKVAPEIHGYAEQIVKNTLGTQAKFKGFEWFGGGLYNKVFKLNTTVGNFILKMECDIFNSTRKEQIENEVYGNQIFQKAGIPCANILAYDFTANDIGTRYVFMEHINGEKEDSVLWGGIESFDEITQAEIERQFMEAVYKMRTMTTTHFGSVSPSGILGKHEKYEDFYRSTLNLLIKDSENCGLFADFTDEESEIVKKAVEKPLIYSKKYTPTFVHGDIGYHNSIWGNTRSCGAIKLHVIDFGNAFYGLPYSEEIICQMHGKDVDLISDMDLDKSLYRFEDNLIFAFDKMFWTVTEQLTEDYAYGWHVDNINNTKKEEKSRNHITEFVDKCRAVL
jgi:aminoglycoside phosphotransferase (APT) family kinase protein